MPIYFAIFLPIRLVYLDSYPFTKLFSFIQIPLYLVQFVKRSSWD